MVNRSCAKSWIASNESRSRLTRGNDPEDRNALPARARLRSGVLPVVMPKEAPKFPLSTSALESQSGGSETSPWLRIHRGQMERFVAKIAP